MLRILTEDIQLKDSSDSKLQIESISSIGILSILEVIKKTSFLKFAKWSTLFQAREILDDKNKSTEKLSSDFLNLNQMVSTDYKRPDEKFNIRVTIDCISKFIQPKAEGIDSNRYHEGLKKPISGFERIITG